MDGKKNLISQGPHQTVAYLNGSNHLFSQQSGDFLVYVIFGEIKANPLEGYLFSIAR